MADARVVAFVPDLMDRSKLAAVAGIVFVATADEVASASADIAVVDLSRPGSLDVLGRVRASRVIAFGSHVDHARLDAARATGCEVLPRSAFFGRIRDLLG